MAHVPWPSTIGRKVPGSGPRESRICLLAEAPGSDEEDLGVPLVGQAGKFLFDGDASSPWPGLTRLGLGRDVVRLENVLERRPPDNDLTTVSLESMAKARVDVRERLGRMPNLELLVPMGNCALNAILDTPLKRKKKRSGVHERGYTYEWVWPHTISAWRGSVNPMEIGGRPVTVIPLLHPAAFLYGDGGNFQAWRGDWLKIRRAYEDGIEISPKLNTIIGPTWDQVRRFEQLVQHTWHWQGDDALLVLDIETVGEIIDCIGFCVDGETTLTLPLLPQLWPGGKTDASRAWQVVERLVKHPIPKGTWWGYYDVYRLERQKGWRVRKWWWDGFNLHHLFDPADEHSLAYCASRDLDFFYWKHIGKTEQYDKETKKDWRARHTYCGYDAGAEWHLIIQYIQRARRGWEATWVNVA